MKCPNCKLDVHTFATRCPHCHGSIPQFYFFYQIAIGLVIGVVTLALIRSCGNTDQSAGDRESSDAVVTDFNPTPRFLDWIAEHQTIIGIVVFLVFIAGINLLFKYIDQQLRQRDHEKLQARAQERMNDLLNYYDIHSDVLAPQIFRNELIDKTCADVNSSLGFPRVVEDVFNKAHTKLENMVYSDSKTK